MNVYLHSFRAALLVLFLGSSMLRAQEPAVLLLGATVHVGDGTVIENAAVGIKDGVFNLVADARLIRIDRSAYDTIITCEGKHIYPGFIAAVSAIGLREIGAVRATQDDYEVGNFKPHVRSAIAFNTDSRVIATLRSNGILVAQVVPLGGRLSGTSSIMHLDGWNWEDAILVEDDAIHLNWPSYLQGANWWDPNARVKKNDDYDASVDAVYDYFEQARAYGAEENPAVKNLAFEAMRKVFYAPSGEGGEQDLKKVFIRCRTAKEIVEVIRFGEAMGLDFVLVDAHQAYMVAELLHGKDIPVILEQTHRLPPYGHSDVDAPFRTPALLAEAGVRFGITVGSGWDAFWSARNLPYQAGTAAAYGLDPEQAIASITGNVAEILGVADKFGTISPELQATLIVCSGDALEMREGNVEHAWIKGEPVDLNRDPQKQLYHRFAGKYGLPIPAPGE